MVKEFIEKIQISMSHGMGGRNDARAQHAAPLQVILEAGWDKPGPFK